MIPPAPACRGALPWERHRRGTHLVFTLLRPTNCKRMRSERCEKIDSAGFAPFIHTNKTGLASRQIHDQGTEEIKHGCNQPAGMAPGGRCSGIYIAFVGG